MSELTPLTDEALNTLRGDFAQSGTNRLAMNAVTAAGIDKVARNYDRARLMQRRFSTIVDNGEATHQDRSGRCWLFSSLNVARFVAKKNMNLKEFEFSQNYAMYYDKLERVNYFLKDVAALVAAGEPSDSRLMQHLLADVMGDGGQWTMAMNVYKKYGAVPKDLFPETESSKNTGEMNIQLRHMLHTAVAHMYAADGDASKVEAIIADATAAGHRILTIHLGEPPVSFDWEWTDKDGEFHLSNTALYFLNGILEHARAITAIGNPTVNSYKRLIPGFEAPVYIAWAAKNRSPLVRIPSAGEINTRLEMRSADPTANPYLLLAACLTAGLNGIKEQKMPMKPVEENIFEMTEEERAEHGIKPLPTTLHNAIKAFKKDDLIKSSLGDHLMHSFIESKELEWSKYSQSVSDWERQRYMNW